jgi:hypothetical protein
MMIGFSDYDELYLGYLTAGEIFHMTGNTKITLSLIVPYSTVTYDKLRILSKAVLGYCKRIGRKDIS